MGKKRSLPKGMSFSWKRATGISQAKANLSRKTGVPMSRSGMQRKVGAKAGCCIPLILFATLAATLTLAACKAAPGPAQPQAVIIPGTDTYLPANDPTAPPGAQQYAIADLQAQGYIPANQPDAPSGPPLNGAQGDITSQISNLKSPMPPEDRPELPPGHDPYAMTTRDTPPRPAAARASSIPSNRSIPSNSTQGNFVYVVGKGKKYHYQGCQFIRNATSQVTPLSLSDAQRRGYTACQVCYN